jgi:hypothetical protein
VSTEDKPEQLLAEALRAQATHAPAGTSPVGYGLLSGSDLGRLAPGARPEEPASAAVSPPRQVHAALVLLLALLLGLAAGAVVGLLTLV